MSSRMSADVLNRKLGPVYECLDDRNYKGAVKLCQKKDIADFAITKTLHAYALICLHRNDEGLAMANEVKASAPVDEGVLRTLGHAYRLLRRDKDTAECYETALARSPDNETFATELFRCYARLGNAKNMQTVAMKMFKSTASPRFIFWGVCSMLLMDDLSSTTLTLAERMLRRVLFEAKEQGGSSTKRMPGAGEMQLWLEVLHRQATALAATSASEEVKKIKEAVETLRQLTEVAMSHSASTVAAPSTSALPPTQYRIDTESQLKEDPSLVEINPMECQVKEINLISSILSKSNGNGALPAESRTYFMNELERVCEALLSEYPDQWNAHLTWINQTVANYLSTGDVSGVVSHRHRLQRMQDLYPSLRGPFLAEMHLLTSLLREKKAERVMEMWAPTLLPESFEAPWATATGTNPAVSELSSMLCRYIMLFDKRQCCFTDIKSYLDILFLHWTAESFTYRDAMARWVQVRADIAEASLWRQVLPRVTKPTVVDNAEGGIPVADDICRLCKLQQILRYLNDCNEVESDKTAILRSIAMFSAIRTAYPRPVTVPLKDGQPCEDLGDRGIRNEDELLVIGSNLYAALYRRLSERSSTNVPGGVQRFFRDAALTQLLSAGRKQSVFNYVFPLELILGPLRGLCAAETAVSCYSALKVKYIQVDSMSYIILPLLFESGMFREAAVVLRDVCVFHQTASQDAGDMVYRSCKGANYMKALEIKKFGTRCSRSVQLAMAQAELPLLELVDSKHSWDMAAAYLRQLKAGDLIESVMDASITPDMLVENMDYEILPPTFGQGDTSSDGWKRAVRDGYLRRISRGRSVIDALCLLDEKKFAEARGVVDVLRSATLEEQIDSSLSVGTSGAEFDDARPLPSFVSSGSAAFDSLLWTSTADVVDFAVQAALFLQSGGAEVLELEGRVPIDASSALFRVQASLLDHFMRLHNDLDVSYEMPCPTAAADKAHRVLDPVWIRKASAVTRVLVPVAALALEFLSLPVRNEGSGCEVRAVRLVSVADSGAGGKKNSAKKKAAVPEAQQPAPADSLEGLAKAVALSAIRLFDLLSTKLHEGETAVSQASVTGFIEAWRQQAASLATQQGGVAVDLLFPDAAIERQRGTIAEAVRRDDAAALEGDGLAVALRASLELLLDGRSAAASQVASSQRTSCSRLAEAVDHKLKHLKHLFP